MCPVVSVLLPIAGTDYKRVAVAIESIINQTLRSVELICIIDEPGDHELRKLVMKYKSSCGIKLTVLENKQKFGIANSLNRALKFTHAKYIARMDADDESFPTRLELQYKFMEENSKIDLVGMQAIKINSQGAIIGKSRKPLSEMNIEKYARFACPLIHPTWFIRSAVLKRLGGYFDISPAQDYHLIIRMLNSGCHLANLPQPGIKYTVLEGSVSHKNIFTSVKVTNLLRKQMCTGINNDLLIKQTVSAGRRSIYFETLHAIRRYGLKLMASRSSLYVVIAIPIIFFCSLFHKTLLTDTFALFNILRMKSAIYRND